MNLGPIKAWAFFLLLTGLSKASPPLPKRMTARFGNSAAKRDPRRIIVNGVDTRSYDYLLTSWAKLRKEQALKLAALVQSLQGGPKFSVVVPVYNPQPKLLAEMIESIRVQSYENWELCLADDCSTDPAVHRVLRDYAARDPRIKVVFREENGHICAASNSAIELATGEFIVLVDHDDLIDPDALLMVAKEITDHPDAMIIYSDEDKITVNGKRYGPYFKCDWNRLLAYTNNYVCHLGTYRADLVRKIGCFRLGYEGSQDHDLLLRCSEHAADHQIRHIPKVLYSWRASPGSVAEDGAAKPYAWDTGQRAVTDHLQRFTGQSVKVEKGEGRFTYRPNWPMQGHPLVSIIIPTRDKLDILRVTVESVLQKTTYTNYEIIIIDNGSVAQNTLDWLAKVQADDARVRVLRDDRPFNYSALNNAAVAVSHGEYILLLNNDIEVISPDWLTEMLSLAQRDRAGCIGAKLYYPDGTLQHAGVIAGLGGLAGHIYCGFSGNHPGQFGRLKFRQNLTVVTAACMLVSREIFDQVGGLNEIDLTIGYNDVDFCLKVAEAGYQNAWTPFAELIHHESASRGYEDTPEKQARFQKEAEYIMARWKTQTYNDPAYNPNLTRDRGDFSFGPPIWTL
jgi:glycosyltransferase involved in cell wall biosynthesis